MIKKNILIHITDDKIYIKNDKKIIEEETYYTNSKNEKHKTVVNGKVYSYTHFLNLMQYLVKKHKLNNSIFNNNVTVIVNSFITPFEKQAIKNIFKSLSFRKVILYKETKIFKKIINDKKILLNINNGYTEIFYYNKKLINKKRIKKITFFSSKQYLKNVTDIIFEMILNVKDRKLLLIAYGDKKEISKIANIIEKKLKVKISNFENNSQLTNYL